MEQAETLNVTVARVYSLTHWGYTLIVADEIRIGNYSTSGHFCISVV